MSLSCEAQSSPVEADGLVWFRSSRPRSQLAQVNTAAPAANLKRKQRASDVEAVRNEAEQALQAPPAELDNYLGERAKKLLGNQAVACILQHFAALLLHCASFHTFLSDAGPGAHQVRDSCETPVDVDCGFK